RDMNGDGAPDLYICNDLFPPDRIWINQGKGRKPLTPAVSPLRGEGDNSGSPLPSDGRGVRGEGVSFRALSNLAVRNTSRFSMGVDCADLNLDGYDEFF